MQRRKLDPVLVDPGGVELARAPREVRRELPDDADVVAQRVDEEIDVVDVLKLAGDSGREEKGREEMMAAQGEKGHESRATAASAQSQCKLEMMVIIGLDQVMYVESTLWAIILSSQSILLNALYGIHVALGPHPCFKPPF